ncbi:alpha/beta fold hydrolase [Sphingobium sp. CCH11-B1]|jgi:pimeloyl-ACP methyl ester carboxylesterase|uniref:alpha/beta fold hydrolase n=1 Tax=Sphingobium sp. CCH11-B1 TaxID=1768781 RepID=UPI000834266C|nr:alpha/beta fold hydrolase [Sphingobium sp. CCH11-B1]
MIQTEILMIPVLFLPGLLCDADLWRSQIDGLSDIVAPSIADLTLDDSITDMAARALTSAPPRFALVALSMGGYVAFEILRQAPDRVIRLALLDTSAAPDTSERSQARHNAIKSLEMGKFRGVTSKLLPLLLHPENIDSPVALKVKAMAERVGGAAFVRQQRAILSRLDSRPTLKHIDVPTLVAVGAEDLITPPSQAAEIQSNISGAQMHVFKDCGHLPALEKPEETTDLLSGWLRSA